MARINPIKVGELPQALLEPLKNIDWKVVSCFALAMGAVLLVRHAMQHPRPRIMEAHLADLGFSQRTLDRVYFLHFPDDTNRGWKCSIACRTIIEDIQRASVSQKKHTIVIQASNPYYFHLFDLLSIGLPDGESYFASQEKERSWVHMTLQKLVDKKYIASFQIKKNQSGIPVILIKRIKNLSNRKILELASQML